MDFVLIVTGALLLPTEDASPNSPSPLEPQHATELSLDTIAQEKSPPVDMVLASNFPKLTVTGTLLGLVVVPKLAVGVVAPAFNR